MIHPFNILEGEVQYSLGTFDGQNVMYDFPKILLYLTTKGKMLFGQPCGPRTLHHGRFIIA